MRSTACVRVLMPLVVGATLTGCTDPGSSTGPSAPPSAAVTGATPPSASVTPPTTAAPGGLPTAKPSSARPRTLKDPRAALPVITPGRVGTIGYGAPSAKDKQRFAAVTKYSGGVITSSTVHSLTVGGHDVGAVAVYTTRRGLAKSTAFQDQYVVQLLNAVTASTSGARFVRTKDGVMALTSGEPAVAAWFKDDAVTFVYREGMTPNLAALAQGVRSAPPEH
jgi:hypothetical protein